jgi:hypothetical protein
MHFHTVSEAAYEAEMEIGLFLEGAEYHRLRWKSSGIIRQGLRPGDFISGTVARSPGPQKSEYSRPDPIFNIFTRIKKPPPGCGAGGDAKALISGFHLWEDEGSRAGFPGKGSRSVTNKARKGLRQWRQKISPSPNAGRGKP